MIKSDTGANVDFVDYQGTSSRGACIESSVDPISFVARWNFYDPGFVPDRPLKIPVARRLESVLREVDQIYGNMLARLAE